MHGNFDYFLFVLLSALTFVGLWVLLPKLRKGAALPTSVLLLAGLFVAAQWWPLQNASDDARENVARIIGSLAPTYAVELEHLGHEKVTTETAPDDATYLALVDRIRLWERSSTFAHDIYTVRRQPDGTNVFIVDPESDYNRDGKFDRENEVRTPIGEPVTEVDGGLALAQSGVANFNSEVVHDEWGTWVGAWAPIRGKNGAVEAVVGVDFAADEYLAVVSVARSNVIWRAGIVLALLAAGSAAFGLLKAQNGLRKIAEENSRVVEMRLAATLNSMPMAFIEFDAKGECVRWNPMAERTFGFTADEVIGRQIVPLIVPAEGLARVQKITAELLHDGSRVVQSVNENVTKDGRRITCEWINTVLRDAHGTPVGAVALAQDITERVKLEEHVQKSQRLNAVGQLAAGVAHDFNNILTIITGHAGLVLDHPDLPRELRIDLERIEDAALRASGLTRQLLTFSRQQAMFPRPLNLGRIVENAAAMLARVLGGDISLTAVIEPDLPAVEADAAMLDQIITNLVLNARDAMSRGGAIEIRVEDAYADADVLRRHPDAIEGPAVCLVIEDTGHGIAPEHLSRLFEPFFTTKEPGKGTGLGLSVVHGIVKQHHGWIEVTSQVGEGSIFRIFFPATTKSVAEEAVRTPREDRPEERRRKTILLAEDEEVVRDLARMILERAGYRVLDAADGVEALRIWSQHRRDVDLLLTDMVMPNGVTGRDLSQKLLAEEPELPVVYASGYSLDLTAPDFCETERQVFLPKPYLTDQLIATVQQCLGETPLRRG